MSRRLREHGYQNAGERKLIPSDSRSENLFFDLQEDPRETNNLYASPEHRDEVREMTAAASAGSHNHLIGTPIRRGTRSQGSRPENSQSAVVLVRPIRCGSRPSQQSVVDMVHFWDFFSWPRRLS